MSKKFAMIKKNPDPPKVSAVRTKTTKTYTPEDARTGAKSYGNESLTKPTPEFIRKAQAEGKQVVHHEGKSYRAGRNEHTHEYALKVDVPKVDPRTIKMPTPKKYEKITTTSVAPAQNFGKSPKRKLERVEYLRNKDARGISPERRRKKSQSGY